MGHAFDEHTGEIRRIFRRVRDKRRALEDARPVLRAMASDPTVLTKVLEEHISNPAALNTKHFPSIGFAVASNSDFNLVANCFFPHPQGLTDLTFNAVHHHGDLLLDTVSVFGPGYEHWLFSRPESVDPARDLFSMRLVERKLHTKGNIAFVDAFVPHAVMFPTSLTVTYALWTNRHATSWRERVKQFPIVQRNRETLRRVARRLGLDRRLHINVISFFDYFPSPEAARGFCGMRDRVQFARGPNADYLESLFSVLQSTDNQALGRVALATAARGGVDDPATVRRLAERLERGERIDPRFSEGIHLGVPHMNFKADDILARVA